MYVVVHLLGFYTVAGVWMSIKTIVVEPHCTTTYIHRVSKNVSPLACYNFDTHKWILIFFGRNVTEEVGNQTTRYATLNTLCLCTTWRNGETRNRYTWLHLVFNSPAEGFPWEGRSPWIFSGCQWMAKVPNAVEILPKIWTAWVGHTNITDDRRTGNNI